MKCDDVLSLLDQMLDDPAETEETLAARRHLKECLSCHSAWTKSLSLRERLRELRNQIHMPETLPQRIRALLAPRPTTPAAEQALVKVRRERQVLTKATSDASDNTVDD